MEANRGADFLANDDAALGCMLDPVYSEIFVLPSLNIKKKKKVNLAVAQRSILIVIKFYIYLVLNLSY